MREPLDALRNEELRWRANLDLTDVQRHADLSDEPDELLFQLRRALVVYRQQVLPHLALERERVLPAVLGQGDAASDLIRIMAEELSAVVGRIDAAQADLLQDPDSSAARSHAVGVLSAAAVLATVAMRFGSEVLLPLARRKDTRTMTARPRVAIVGGGFAGLETAFTLRQRLGDQVDLTLISDHTQFLFKPNTIYLPFGYDERRLHIPIARPAARRLVQFHHGVVTGMQQDRVELKDGARVPYDFLVLGTGAAMRPTEVPGLAEHAETIWTPEAMHRSGTGSASSRSAAARGEHRRVLFLVPPGNKCAGPLYEIVFMLDTWLRRHGIRNRVTLTWTTYESSYIQAFGPRLHEVVRTEFARTAGSRAIPARWSARCPPTRCCTTTATRGVPYDLLVAFPPVRRRGRVPRRSGGRPRVPPHRGGDPAGGRDRQCLRARRRGRLPGQAGVPRVPAGRCRRGRTSPPGSTRGPPSRRATSSRRRCA